MRSSEPQRNCWRCGPVQAVLAFPIAEDVDGHDLFGRSDGGGEGGVVRSDAGRGGTSGVRSSPKGYGRPSG